MNRDDYVGVASATAQAYDSKPTRLRAERIRQGLSLMDLARQADVDPTTIWRVEMGRVSPQRSTRVLLAMALACDPSELFPLQNERLADEPDARRSSAGCGGGTDEA
jgi:transcriptional regulator with XRE-family HTH domain